ncbi:hypothetical protein GJU43_10005 [Flavobacterium sp. LC2016-23]|uniref:hypothetical protein n=1 Tax=Flavobacterium sp. LC2016-23 TaxID=2666330 RepID=UPI0012AF0D9F|nr:hypothetical protein [Flavobacterium sp. LC2016-23]MRX39609.1 hypothetical protein [Flavobacterium sp. LC2016-23]
MEPNNFEKDFREKLNQRKIEPSDKAWDRLDAMLSVAEEKKPKKKNRWLYIAASIIGFLLAGTFFLNQEKNMEIPKTQVVIEENIQKDSVVKKGFKAADSTKDQIAVSEKEALQNAENSKTEEKISNQNLPKTIKNTVNPIAEVSIINQNNQNNQQPASGNYPINMSEKPKNETPEQLLNTAQKSVIAENSVKPKAKIKINASDLLNQVDGELELSFREKVITRVNKNYQTVKVALANRNQQE